MQVLDTFEKKVLGNLKKCEFTLQSLACFEYVIGGGEIKIDLKKIDVIIKWPTPINVTKVRIFVEVKQYI